MSKRTLYFLLVSWTLIAVVFIFVHREKPEPQYGGKSLSEWVERLWPPASSAAVQLQARDAIRHIGTNAIPYLLVWIQYESPQWKMNFYLNANKILGVLHAPLCNNKKLDRATGCVQAFDTLGPEAKGAIPALAFLMNDPKACKRTQYNAFASLAGLGPSVAPLVVAGLTNRDPILSSKVLIHLVRERGSARPALPALLTYPEDRVRRMATNAVRAIEPDALGRGNQ